MVEQVLLNFLYCINNGIEYKGDREYNKWNDEKFPIALNSLE